MTSWFTYAVTSGARSPKAVLAVLTRVVGKKLDWPVEPLSRQLCQNTLTVLRCDQQGALSYARAVPEEKGVVTDER